MIKRGCVLGFVLLFWTTSAFGQIGGLFERLGIGNRSTLSDSKVSSGLKEALQIGTDNAVRLTGRPDGYFANEAIKILLPKSLNPLERGLRTVGYGPKVDAFVLSMNRSAEAAAPAAKRIFLDAILSMTFDDARKILSGGDTAATEYFRGKTTEPITLAFRPVIEKTMDENGAARQYNQLVVQSQTIPLLRRQDLDITEHVVSQALNGLFYVLGQEEAKIRKDPASRTTDLLRQVFRK